MKNLNYVLFLMSMFVGSTTFAQSNLDLMTRLLNSGDIKNITEELDEKVEVSIMENDTYTKTDAQTSLYNFFFDKINSDYVAIHKGNSSNESYYQIGGLRTENKTYRTYFYTTEKNGNFLIQELRIEQI